MKKKDIINFVLEDLVRRWGSTKVYTVVGGTIIASCTAGLILANVIPNDPIELKGEE